MIFAHAILALQVAVCGDCSIRAERLLRIGDAEGRGTLSRPTGIARTRDGGWVITHSASPGEVILFSATGSFVKSVGRRGSGPGEYRSASLATVGPGDSIWVFDSQLMRASVLDQNLKFVRSYSVPGSPVVDLAVLPDGRLILSAQYRTEERAGYPLHIVERDGTISKSIGIDRPVYRRDKPTLSRRSFWPANSNSIWTADVVQYRLQLWTLDGTRLKEIVREVEWFRPHDNFRYPASLAAEPHPPGLISVHQDTSGLLWTIVRVPDQRWKSALGPRQNILGKVTTGVLNREKYWDSLVEVLDPRTGRLVASTRLDAVLERFVAERMAFQYEEDAVGEPSVVIWEFKLTR